MNTKEAIEFCERLKHCDKTFSDRGCKERLCKIQKLLQRGKADKKELKKVWQMWGKCKKDMARASVENWKVSAERFLLEMNKLEQKYFPKPLRKISRDEAVDIQGDIDDEILRDVRRESKNPGMDH